ncbi:MAG TPA: hypothetical protein DD396_02600 [Bacteroidetes bacterium]|nr:hypothetical protein [Bacteroidota bacterium]
MPKFITFTKMRKLIFILTLISTMGADAQIAIQDVAHQLAKHKYKKVYRCFDANMQDKVSAYQLKKIWEQMELSAGKLGSVVDVRKNLRDGGSRQSAMLQFEQAAVKMTLSVNENGEINGLYISQLAYEPPLYGKDLGVGKKYINFPSHSYTISGELVIPLECQNCPVVLLVHGSGPNDKDETIGPNKVFNDLALGFASKGIATYRYDKRSYLYPDSFNGQFDLYDETINDAISAFYHLKADTSLHFGKYIMLGHSLGAYAMPIIADSLQDKLNGAILFSVNASKIEDLIAYQMKYLTEYDGEITKEEAKIIAENTKQAENIRLNRYTAQTTAEELLAYWPGTFWKGIEGYDPIKTLAKNTAMQFYILQGKKDYQIPMSEFELWQAAVGANANIKMQSYANLTHLFTPTKSERPSPADYFSPNNVEFQVIWDMADWIKLVLR